MVVLFDFCLAAAVMSFIFVVLISIKMVLIPLDPTNILSSPALSVAIFIVWPFAFICVSWHLLEKNGRLGFVQRRLMKQRYATQLKVAQL